MIIAIANPEPGCGKTTAAMNIAAALALSGQSVLLVDGDPRGGFENLQGLSESAIALDRKGGEFLCATSTEGLSVLYGLGRRIAQGDAEGHAREKLDRLVHEFQWVVLDTPSSSEGALKALLGIADEVLVPIQNTARSWEHLARLLALVLEARNGGNGTLKLGGLVRVNATGAAPEPAAEATFAAIAGEFGAQCLQASISADAAIARTRAGWTSVVVEEPDSPGAEDYRRLAAELQQRHGRPAPRIVAAAPATAAAAAGGVRAAFAEPPRMPAQSAVDAAGRKGLLSSMLRAVTDLFGRR